jgi:hypothetical protein
LGDAQGGKSVDRSAFQTNEPRVDREFLSLEQRCGPREAHDRIRCRSNRCGCSTIWWSGVGSGGEKRGIGSIFAPAAAGLGGVRHKLNILAGKGTKDRTAGNVSIGLIIMGRATEYEHQESMPPDSNLEGNLCVRCLGLTNCIFSPIVERCLSYVSELPPIAHA